MDTHSGDASFKSSSETLSLTVGSSADVVIAPISRAPVAEVLGSLGQESKRETLVGDLAFERVPNSMLRESNRITSHLRFQRTNPDPSALNPKRAR